MLGELGFENIRDPDKDDSDAAAAASTAPATSLSGALSPPMASRAIRAKAQEASMTSRPP